MEVMSVESEYNAYGERIRVVSSLGADTELSYDRIGLVGGIKATVGKTETDEASAYGDAGGDVRPWESTIGRDDAGREVERFATGGIRITTDYNDMGLVRSRHVRSGNRHTGWRSYRWDVGARLMSMRGNLSPEPVIFDYDSMCNLVRGDYSMHESVFRTPDKVGNLYREDGCKGREYDRGGRLLWDGEYHYRYDCEGNLVHKSRRDVSVPENNGHTEKKGWLGMLFSADDTDNKDNSLETDPFACWQPGDTCYEWQANGMLAGVRTPDGRTITFGYDALGRRVSKRTGDTVHRFGWDGNVVLHEWDTDEALRPRLVTDETGREEYDGTEKPEGLVTWVYDGTSFTPVAKVTDGERYTIVHDYLGTPTQAYDSKGELVWEMLLDVYGKVEKCHGDRTLVPFRYQGQYEDEETGLYYNRFRYYSPDMGMYISSDPIGLAGNNPTLYGYVLDVNTWLDVWGLYNGEGERTLGIYDVYHSYNLSVSNYTQSDSQQFSLANESLYKRFEADPDFANQMEAKYPGIKDHVSPGKKGGFSTDAPPGTTWHHSDTPGILELVDRNDHQKYHKIYHPDGSGGRKKWGGGTICR